MKIKYPFWLLYGLFKIIKGFLLMQQSNIKLQQNCKNFELPLMYRMSISKLEFH